MKPANLERVLLVFSGCLFLGAEGKPQVSCTAYRVHAFPGVCGGSIALDCVGVDSVVWSTGATGFQISAPPGIYSYDAYNDGELVYSGSSIIESHGWVISDIMAFPYATSLWLGGSASIAYCGTSIFNTPCCSPEVGDVELYAIQDGILPIQEGCIGCTQYPCFGPSFLFTDLEYGHEYCVRLVDSHCGVTVGGNECVIAHSCANLALDVSILPSIPGDGTGVIELIEALPDTTEPYPIQAPVTGTITLHSLPSNQLVDSTLYNAGSAIWTGLDTGYYVLEFAPDAGCQWQWDTLYVPAETNTGPINAPAALVLSMAPTVADATLRISSSAGSAFIHIHVIDIDGRSMLKTVIAPGLLSVECLAPGAYVLIARQGDEVIRSRFIKR